MWTCKSCGHQVEDNLDECSNCGTGINWSPPTDAQLSSDISNSGTLTTQTASNTGPIPEVLTTFLRITGIAVAIIGLIAGLIVLTDTPQNPLSTLYLMVGLAQIIGGLTAGALLYAVAGIGDAVRDLWKAQHKI